MQPRSGSWSGLGRLASLPLWARLIMLTAAGLFSLIGSSLFLSSALHQTAERTTKMKDLFDVVETAGEAHVTFGEMRYWLTDLSVSQLVISERNASAAQEKLDAHLDRLVSYDPGTVAAIRSEVEAYVSRAMDAADAYTDGNRVIGNTLLANARTHSTKVDEALNRLVDEVSTDANAERQIVVKRADGSARAAFYIVIVLSLIGLALTAMVFRSIVHPLRRLNDAITGLMQGRYDVEIPTEEGHEFGAMALTLRRFRENAIERERLESEAEQQKQRLIQAEKMASLGQLTAGIAHEIKNPLNFVNNFAKLSDELLAELADVLRAPIAALDEEARADAEDLFRTVHKNLGKINDHGNRADSIVKNMLLHSREGPSECQTVDLNAIADEALNLAYHGMRAEHPSFNIEMAKSLAPEVGEVDCYPQDLMRVFLNLISNGMYAANKRSTQAGDGFSPTISLTTRTRGGRIEIEVHDNGIGITPDVRGKIFMPFFTTKPAGEGTGLGLSLSYDIVVKQHGGELTVDSQPGEFTAFLITLKRTLVTEGGDSNDHAHFDGR
ncbi:ATP-binding protein [Gammaproteobacteria bacterium]|nr:ATP-binding protein [Gammaproteobacteria bacterium]